MFIPMIMGTGGNAGGQSSVTIIRGLSLNEITMKDIWRIMWKEFRVSLLCGATLAIVTFVKVLFFDRLSLLVSAVVAITIFATLVIAKLVGCILPMLAKKLRLDPAVMASPFITTIVDALSMLIYFKIAQWILHM